MREEWKSRGWCKKRTELHHYRVCSPPREICCRVKIRARESERKEFEQKYFFLVPVKRKFLGIFSGRNLWPSSNFLWSYKVSQHHRHSITNNIKILIEKGEQSNCLCSPVTHAVACFRDGPIFPPVFCIHLSVLAKEQLLSALHDIYHVYFVFYNFILAHVKARSR